MSTAERLARQLGTHDVIITEAEVTDALRSAGLVLIRTDRDDDQPLCTRWGGCCVHDHEVTS